MSIPNGYNNPAYCHQYDTSLYDYQYVPEIDPDSPDLEAESNRRHTKLVHPNFRSQLPSDLDENVGSDESNGSIIIEECNNRRVTLICEKRSRRDCDSSEFHDDREEKATYYQDVSLESENVYDHRDGKSYLGRSNEAYSRHKRPLDPPSERQNNGCNREYSTGNNRKYYTRQHRYEEIPGAEDQDDEDEDDDDGGFCSLPQTSVHRYAEISPDENGFPTIKKPFEVQKTNVVVSGMGNLPKTKPIKVMPKPRAVTPVQGLVSFSPPPTPSRSYPKKPSEFRPVSPSQRDHSTSPVKTNSFEMAELSPPRSFDSSQLRSYPTCGQTYFINSPKRQPPIGASPAHEIQDPHVSNSRCILPTHLQKQTIKLRKERSHSVPNSPKRTRNSSQLMTSSPDKPSFDRKVMQIFHKKSKPSPRDGREKPVRRNISNSFTDPPREPPLTPKRKSVEPVVLTTRSPYKPTTTEIVQPKTAVITPIFQRKNQQQQDQTPQRDFGKMSQTFQSTGNLFRPPTRDRVHPENEQLDFRLDTQARLKRNRSVPNFVHTFTMENGLIAKKTTESYQRDNQKLSKANLQYSPIKRPVENLSPINKSRLSLIERSRSSWSNTDSDDYPRCSTCFIFATIIHLVTATATCAISFYLLSRMGRRYYLDFGIIAGFINFTLGLLGFRSYCWRWLPNRNYVSGFIGLAAFSAFQCAGLAYLIIVRPMAGDPVLDLMGGAIGAVSVLTILLALTGLTMSGCCKSPPPDNRVADL